NSNTEQVTVRYFPQTVMANTIIDSLNISARAIRNIVMSSDVSVMNKQNQRIAESRKAIDDALVEFDKITQSQEGKVLIAAIKQARDTYRVDQEKAVRLAMAQQDEESVNFLFTEMEVSQVRYFTAVEDMVKHVSKRVETSGAEAKSA